MVHKVDLVIIGVSVGLAVGILIATLVFFGIWWYKRHKCPSSALPTNKSSVVEDTSIAFNNSVVTVKLSTYPAKTSPIATLLYTKASAASGLLKYSYKDVQNATKNFTTILGQGSFGPVYKAVMPAGEIVAVSLLGRLHHRNLVNLVGYCVDKRQRMLIYEYMRSGSLASFLYNEEKTTLNWEERLQIALDISHGIEYLHDGVADFGLSKEEEVYDDKKSCVKGTYGYIDPVYASTNKFTKKSDIYSFGIILFELITAIHPHQNLMEYVNLAAMSSDGADEILDKKLAGECDLEEVRTLARLAHRCLHKTPTKRPTIGEASQAIKKLKHRRRITRSETASFGGQEFSGFHRVATESVKTSMKPHK
uniref:Putative tyrosine-protein kinase, Fes/Fps type n=1 Tax=Helianthus annuus TaxID=4232 RepID=A0A251RU42_HELAN